MKNLFSSYRNRTILTYFGMVLILVFVYQNNIRTTIELYKEYTQMEEKLNQNADLVLRVSILQQRVTELNGGNLATGAVDSLTQSAMLDVISKTSARYSLKLYNIGDPVLYTQHQYQVELNMVALEGSFINLTKAIHYFETTNSLKANLMSVDYKLVKSYSGKGDRLVATLYLQRVQGRRHNEK